MPAAAPSSGLVRRLLWCAGTLLVAGVQIIAQSSADYYATYVGGTRADASRDVAVDGQGYIYVVGGTESAEFATTAGAYDRTHNGSTDAYLAKFGPNGALVYSTFIGGGNYDRAYAVELDAAGNVYMAGRAGAGFPVTAGVVQPTFGGDVAPNTLYGPQDGFIAKFSSSGALLWSTYLGGDDLGFFRDLALDGSGNVYVVGVVRRPNPHITANAFQRVLKGSADEFVAKVSSDGTRVLYASYLGGSGTETEEPSIRVDSQGFAYVLTVTNSTDLAVSSNAFQRVLAGGDDWLLAKIAPDGSSLSFLTYLGSTGNESTETHNLSLDSAGTPYITAWSAGTTLPTTAGAFQRNHRGNGGAGTGGGTNYAGDGYIAKLSIDGTQLIAATYFGGSAGDAIEGSAVDSAGNVLVTGGTFSADFPVSAGARQSNNRGGADVFVASLSPDLSTLRFSTYLGDSGAEIGRSVATDAAGNLYAAGETNSSAFPVSANGFDRSLGGGFDGFVLRHPSVGAPPVVNPAAPTNLRIIR